MAIVYYAHNQKAMISDCSVRDFRQNTVQMEINPRILQFLMVESQIFRYQKIVLGLVSIRILENFLGIVAQEAKTHKARGGRCRPIENPISRRFALKIPRNSPYF